MKSVYSVGEVASLMGISAQTIRKYEQAGLISTARHENNYRHFQAPDITMLMRIRLFRNLGFSLDMIKTLVKHTKGNLTDLYDKRIAELEEQIQRLELMRECTLLHKKYYEGTLNNPGILIEPSPELKCMIYRNGRSIEPQLIKDSQLASVLEFVPPYQYFIRLPKDTYRDGKTEFETGFAMPVEFSDRVPSFEGSFVMSSRICVAVTIRHDVRRIDNRWETIYLPDDFERAGVYDFMAKNNLELKGDIFGITHFDTYDGNIFSHYIKYYFPVF